MILKIVIYGIVPVICLSVGYVIGFRKGYEYCNEKIQMQIKILKQRFRVY